LGELLLMAKIKCMMFKNNKCQSNYSKNIICDGIHVPKDCSYSLNKFGKKKIKIIKEIPTLDGKEADEFGKKILDIKGDA